MKRLWLFLIVVVLCLTAVSCSASREAMATVPTTMTTVTTTTTTTTTATPATVAGERVRYLGLYDTDTQEPLYESWADERIYPASLVKITTAYTALHYLPADTEIAVGSELSLVKPHSSVCRIQRGHRLPLRDLIAGMLMSSGNDAAYTVAVNVARTAKQDAGLTDKDAVAYFCKLMNETAHDLGAVNSHYVNPEGWDDERQYTTVRDLSILIRKAMRIPEIRDAVSSVEKTVSVGNGQTLTFRNTNLFLHKSSNFYDERVTGFKTGSTSHAGKCLATTLVKDGKTYIAIVMNCSTDTDRYQTMQNVLKRIP